MFRWAPTSLQELSAAESDLLSCCNNVSTFNVQISNEQTYIHTAEIKARDENTPPTPDIPIVLCHGFGTGIGIWYRNYDGLAKGLSEGQRILAFDWLGMGLSSRPTFTCKGVDESERFFVDSMEEWRKKQGIAKMTLVGHSLGGYLATAYTAKYPDHVKHLVLASPVGVLPKPEEDPNKSKSMSWSMWTMRGIFRTLWSTGTTPQSLLRICGPWGPSMIQGYIDRRLPHINDAGDNEDGQKFLRAYLYHNAAVASSGAGIVFFYFA